MNYKEKIFLSPNNLFKYQTYWCTSLGVSPGLYLPVMVLLLTIGGNLVMLSLASQINNLSLLKWMGLIILEIISGLILIVEYILSLSGADS